MLSMAAWLMLSGMMQSLRLAGNTGSFPKPLGVKEEAFYLEKASKGDLEARNILIERNLRLVAHIMKKYYTATSDQEDLISIGTIGLIKGISTFDPTKGARLATYAARCVENEILMHFRSQKKSSGDVSLSECIETGKDGNALSLLDVICASDDLFENLSTKEAHGQLYETMARIMTKREKLILTLRYGLGETQSHAQREIAQLLGISRSYVSRLEKKALEKLRRELEGR
ncbi:MAG: RNA polymerase sporulation sigma factor SigK [Eubacteriales bacterium]